MGDMGDALPDLDYVEGSIVARIRAEDDSMFPGLASGRILTPDEAFALDAQLRYGIQRRNDHDNTAGSKSIAAKIVTRVAQHGAQAPTRELVVWLNMSRRDLAEGVHSALAEMCRLHFHALWNPNERRKSEILSILKKWDPFSPNTMTNSSELIEVDCEKFLDMLRDVPFLWQWRHPNPEKKDKSLDFSSVSHIYGGRSAELSGFMTPDVDHVPDPALSK